MFWTLMASRFLRICHSPTIITIKCHRLCSIWNDFQINQELTKPYSFLGCFTSCHIFSFHGGISNAGLLYTPPYHWSSIQGENWPWSRSLGIPICLEVRISISCHFQVNTWKDKHIVSRSPKILENILDCGPVIRSRVGLEAAYHAYGIAYVKSGTKHYIHETSYGWSVRIPSHVLNLLRSLRRLLLREVNSMNEWEHSFLGVLHGISGQHLINIRCLGKHQLSVLPISKDLNT